MFNTLNVWLAKDNHNFHKDHLKQNVKVDEMTARQTSAGTERGKRPVPPERMLRLP